MALYPCQRCGMRYAGPSNRAYCAIMDGGVRWDYKPRVCLSCVEDLVELFEAVRGRVELIGEDYTEPTGCLNCRGSVDGHHPQSVFMTLFQRGAERADYFAPLCTECRPDGQHKLVGVWQGHERHRNGT